jgi:hypothetical protein
MEQQTALDWFVQQLEESGIDMGSGIKMAYPIPYDIYKEAKAMEKEQIIEAYQEGEYVSNKKIPAEQYYNQTYENR